MYTYIYQYSVNPVKKTITTIDPITGETRLEDIMKSSKAIQAEMSAIVASKTAEIQTKVNAYIAAQAAQGVGNPGPVAEFEIMKIVNEHDGEFEVVLET